MFNNKKIYILLFLVFLILRFLGIQFGLPYDGIHSTENFTITHILHYLSTGSLKPLDFQHPSLYQYLLTFIAKLSGLKNYLYLYLLARLLSCLASFFAVYFLYLLAKRLFDLRAMALLCASFLGFNLLGIKYSHYAVPDSLSLLFIILSLFFSLLILQRPSLRNYLLCGLFCGLSIASKFSGFLSLGFFIFAHFLETKERNHGRFFLGLLTGVSVFFLASPFHLFYFKEAQGDFFNYISDKGYFSFGLIKSQGYLTYPLILIPDAFGLLAFASSILGFCAMLFKDNKRALLLLFPSLIYFLLIGSEKGGTIQNLLPLFPVLSIFSAYLFFSLRKLNRASLVILALLILLPNFTKSALFDYFLLKKDTRILAEEWLIKNVKEKAKIGFERYSPMDLNYIEPSLASQRFNAVYFVPSLCMYPATFYKEEGYDYIVTSNFRRDSYQFFCKRASECDGIKNYQSFDAQFRLMRKFEPAKIFNWTAVTLPWGTWPHNPIVSIYKVKE